MLTLVVVAAAVVGCGPGDEDPKQETLAAAGSRSLPEAIAAANALSALLAKPNVAESCGLRPGGEAECWGSIAKSWGFRPEGVFVAVSEGVGFACGLRPSGEVDCWGDTVRIYKDELNPPDGAFSAISAGGWRVCGLRPGGEVECWGLVEELLEGVEAPVSDVAFPGGAFSSVSVGGGHVCGLRPGGEVACWGVNWFGQADAPPGRFVAVDSGDSHSCGLRGDGSVECWGEDSRDAADLMTIGFRFGGDEAAYVAHRRGPDLPEWMVVPSSVALLDLRGAVPEAGLREEMARRAAGWEPPEGPFVAVSAGDGFTCALRLDGEAACWGYFAREEPRIPLEVYEEVYGPHLWDFHDATRGQIALGERGFQPRFYPLYESLYGARVWELDPAEYAVAGLERLPIKLMVADLRLIDPPPGPFIAVEAGTRRACGLRPNGDLDCWGIEAEDSAPPPGPFATEPITPATPGG